MTDSITIRETQPEDNQAIKKLVLDILAEFELHGEGYAGVDAELEDMHNAYQDHLSAYYVVINQGDLIGVGGFAPLAGTEPGTVAELRKMYFLPAWRGQGLGQKLIERCLTGAANCGYAGVYLETVPAMKAAQSLYQKNGFNYLSERMGDTGHSNCGVHMYKVLNA